MERLVLLPGSYFCDVLTFGMFVFLKELYYCWKMLHFQDMRKKFIQHLDQIPFLQTFRMVRHER